MASASRSSAVSASPSTMPTGIAWSLSARRQSPAGDARVRKLPPGLKSRGFPAHRLGCRLLCRPMSSPGSVTGNCKSPVGRQGSVSDVPGCNDVGMLFVAAHRAYELRLASPIGTFAVATFGTGLGSVPGIHVDHRNTGQPCLVLDERRELGESPTPKSIPRLCA